MAKVAIPSFIQGISTVRKEVGGSGVLLSAVAIPSFIQGISTGGTPLWRCSPMESRSQSLPLFRAFQHEEFRYVLESYEVQSQSLPLFRAFQQGERRCGGVPRWRAGRNPFLYSGHFNTRSSGMCWNRMRSSRNPFLYSGHFNIMIWGICIILRRNIVAIPSFIQGISTTPRRQHGRVFCSTAVAIPSFIQGISTDDVCH